MSKVTYHIPTTEQGQEELKAMVKRLFPEAEPTVTQRATDTNDVDWQSLEHMDFADLLNAQAVYSPFITFTIVEPDTPNWSYTNEQVALFDRPGIVVQREIDPEEFEDFLGSSMLEDHPDF